MDIFQAIVLGIVQGLTEFMPVSSSAHLIIVPWLFKWPDYGLAFDMVLHLGTLVAVLLYFRSDWVRYIRAFFSGMPNFSPASSSGLTAAPPPAISDEQAADRRIAWLLLIATVPGAIFGWLGESKVDAAFHDHANLNNWGIYIIAAAMILLGLVLALAERLHQGEGREMRQMNIPDAVTIGLAQALALIPGVSRSGATITAGLFRNLSRPTAARFSFLMSTPIIFGAGLKEVYSLLKGEPNANPQNLSLLGLALGFIAAAGVGYLTIYYLLGYLQRHTTAVFTIYRLVVGVLIFLIAILGLVR